MQKKRKRKKCKSENNKFFKQNEIEEKTKKSKTRKNCKSNVKKIKTKSKNKNKKIKKIILKLGFNIEIFSKEDKASRSLLITLIL